MSDQPVPFVSPNANSSTMNDAALCLHLANEIDKKVDHNGRDDALMAYALRRLANGLIDQEVDDIPVITVRILVAVDPEGAWESSGSSMIDDPKQSILLDDLAPGFAYRWIEADVPLPPVPPVVVGKVTG